MIGPSTSWLKTAIGAVLRQLIENVEQSIIPPSRSPTEAVKKTTEGEALSAVYMMDT